MSNGTKNVGKADNAKSNQSNGKKGASSATTTLPTAPPADLTPPPAETAPEPNPGEATPEQWSYYGRDVLREPVVSNTIKLEVLTSSTSGNPQSLVLLFALNNHQDFLTKEMLTAIGEKHHQDAYAWHWELQLCNDLIFKIAQGLGGLSQNNLSAAMRLGNRTEYDRGTHQDVILNETMYAKFLQNNLGLTIEEADEEESEANAVVRKAMQEAWGSPQPHKAESVEDYNRAQECKSLLDQAPETGWDAEGFREKLEHLPLDMLKDLLMECKSGGNVTQAEHALIIDEVLKRIADL